jgi:hypothetical protein
MNAIIQCRFCGSKVIASDPSAKSINCPQCAASLPVEGLWNVNAAAIPGAPPIDPVQPPARAKGFPFFLMLLAFPFGLVIFCTALPLFVMSQWAGVAVGLAIGGSTLLFTFRAMRGRWTPGLIIWVIAFASVWIAANVKISQEKHEILKTFGPLKSEFATFAAFKPVQPRPIKPKLFPLFIQERGEKASLPGAPALPANFDDFDLYKHLPDSLKPTSIESVETIALLEWGWRSDTHLGFCKVTVIDRKTRTVVATKTLNTAAIPPLAIGTWYGPQPTHNDVLGYLGKLPLQAEALSTPDLPERAEEE